MSGNLIDNPNAAWVTNGVNAVLPTDQVEGQAAGASHGGLGNSNIAQQVLTNRTAFLYGRQNTNIANISALQSQQSTDVANISALTTQQNTDKGNISTLQGQVAALIAFANGFGIDSSNPGYVEIPLGESEVTLILNWGYNYIYAGDEESQGGFTWWYGANSFAYAKSFGVALSGWTTTEDISGVLAINANVQPGGVGDSSIALAVHCSSNVNVYFRWLALGYTG